jgi:hypothetical protein
MRRLFIAAALLTACDNSDPGIPSSQPEYRWEDGECTSGERGNLTINEVHFAGSVSDSGTLDSDDVFIELWNRHPRPINVSNWRLNVWGETQGYVPDEGYLIPATDIAIPPNGFFVIARKRDGAFGDIADVFIEDLEIGKSHFLIELRDCDQKLMEGAGSRDQPVFSGGYDLVTSRSMERAQLIFQNRGESPINWHAYSVDSGANTIREGWRQRTLASPGMANSHDYSGAAASGNFE